jgi:hypothetical protein
MKDKTVKQVQCVEGAVFVGRGRVNEGDKDQGIWLMDFVNLYETEQ